VPAEVAEHVAARDSIIVELVQETDELRAALDAADEAVAATRLGYESLRNAYTQLLTSHDRLKLTLEQQRPKPQPRWLPRIGFGPGVGVCRVEGQVHYCEALTVHLSWSVR
jgi:hypothetical protein